MSANSFVVHFTGTCFTISIQDIWRYVGMVPWYPLLEDIIILEIISIISIYKFYRNVTPNETGRIKDQGLGEFETHE